MSVEKLVQFVCFETLLDTEEFVSKWEQFSMSGDAGVTLQQSKKNGLFRYIVQQRFSPNQSRFNFEKGRRSSKNPEVAVKAEQAGGYSALELNKHGDARTGESKLFAFLVNPTADLSLYRSIAVPHKLNIYEAYYENCRYSYILEFFTKDSLADDLLHELKHFADGGEIGIYKECHPQLSNQPALS